MWVRWSLPELSVSPLHGSYPLLGYEQEGGAGVKPGLCVPEKWLGVTAEVKGGPVPTGKYGAIPFINISSSLLLPFKYQNRPPQPLTWLCSKGSELSCGWREGVLYLERLHGGDGCPAVPVYFSGSPLGGLCRGWWCVTDAVSILGVFHGEIMDPVGEYKPQSQGGVTEETFFSSVFY